MRVETQILDKLVARWHNQWVLWSKQVAKEEPGISPERLSRWNTLWTDYDKLPENEKDTDRLLAKTSLMAFQSGLPKIASMSRREKRVGLASVASFILTAVLIAIKDSFFSSNSILQGLFLVGVGSTFFLFLGYVIFSSKRIDQNDAIKFMNDVVNSEMAK